VQVVSKELVFSHGLAYLNNAKNVKSWFTVIGARKSLHSMELLQNPFVTTEETTSQTKFPFLNPSLVK